MKNNIILILLVFLVCYTCFSQQRELSGYNLEKFSSEQESLNWLSSLNQDQLISNDSFEANEQNAILIQQIGNNNWINSETQSKSSDIELIQYGDYNEIDLSINAPSITGKIVQKGNSNIVLNSIYYTNLNVKVNSVQNGNNLSINRIGVNSLSNNLQLVQEGSFKTITVISN